MKRFADKELKDQVDRIVQSEDFVNAPKLTKFLTYIVDEYLAGNEEYIKALSIAVNVFDRDLSFDQQNDSIVRMYGGKLRKALDHYYLKEGISDLIRIHIPKGKYIPRFEEQLRSGPSTKEDSGIDDTITDEAVVKVAVELFEFVGADSSQSYFAGGITEQLIQNLTLFSNLTIVGPLQKSTDESLTKDIKTQAAELKAVFLISGKVRSSGDLLKVSVSLVQTADGANVWSKSFVIDLTAKNSIYAEEELASDLANMLGSPTGEIAAYTFRTKKGGLSTRTYDAIMRAYNMRILVDKSQYIEMVDTLRQADKENHDSAQIKALLSEAYLSDITFGLGLFNKSLDEIADLADESIRMDPNNVDARRTQGWLYLLYDQPELAKVEFETALKNNPNNAITIANYGAALIAFDDWDKAIKFSERSLDLNPQQPGWYTFVPSLYYYRLGEFQKALQYAVKIDMPIVFWGFLISAATLGQLEKYEEATWYIDKLLNIQPDFKTRGRKLMKMQLFQDGIIDQLIEGLVKAGLKQID